MGRMKVTFKFSDGRARGRTNYATSIPARTAMAKTRQNGKKKSVS